MIGSFFNAFNAIMLVYNRWSMLVLSLKFNIKSDLIMYFHFLVWMHVCNVLCVQWVGGGNPSHAKRNLPPLPTYHH